MNYGIKTVMLNSPLTHRSSKDGFRGVIYSLGNQGDYTYIGTNYGVYYYTKQSPQIKRMKGVYHDCWNFYNYDGSTFLANTSGVFQIIDSTAKWLTRYTYAHSLAKLKTKNHFVVGTYSIGIWLLKKEKNGWVSHKIKGFDKETRFIKEGAQGHLWVTHYNEGVYKLKLNPERDSVMKQTFYGTKQGLPSTQNTRVYRLNNGKLVFTTVKGFYEYNATTDRFEPIEAFNQALGDQYCVYTFQEDTQGNLYCWLGQGAPYNREVMGVLKKQANGTFKLVTNLFNNIEVATNGLRVDVDAPVMISTSQNKVLIGNLSKLLTYDVTKSANIKQNYQVIIRKFRAGDSSLFRYGSQTQNIVLPYAMHNVDIHYAAMTYENIHKTRYSYWLKGFDTKWSAWRTQPESNFTNLPEGKYTFMVKARNVYGKESQINSFSFQILPPWYRTWWAYTLYVFTSIGVIGLIAWLNSRRLIRQKVVLEQIVKERTDEVMSQNEELKQNQDEILAQRGYIEDQNKHLLQKNTMIQQSIKSALTIQQAFLPSEARVKSFLPKSFIVYQPKDIVSGDFYWIEKVDNKTIVIAADCTGHGVPGAFMSLIGYNLFNKIILQQGYHNPVDILDQLHQQVAIALKQPESNNINGMDLIILIMEDAPQGATQLTFAGARRPLYYLLPHQKDALHVVKGTRKSIGGLQNKRVSFQLHELLLPQNSMLYVGSDGLADQNNPDRKKFGAKRLEDLLQQIAWLPLEEQKAAIIQELTKHMQGAAQRDDILWMGIKT
jgi:serine phosphatase RsbU (regulator of sigma subunit)